MNEFLAGFWVFVGIVAGAAIQFGLGKMNQRETRANALKLFRAEVEINIDECVRLRDRLIYLRDRIAATQITEDNLFISMRGFDYSTIGPLVNSGLLHLILGPAATKGYFLFMGTFNNSNAEVVNSQLRTEHDRGHSLDYIDTLLRQMQEHTDFLVKLRDAKRVDGVLLLERET